MHVIPAIISPYWNISTFLPQEHITIMVPFSIATIYLTT